MEIKAFRALRFNEAVVGDAGRCIAPPYDVVNAAQQQRLYEKSQYNIIRITKGVTTPADNENNNQYTRAAEAFERFQAAGAVVQDNKESIYGYVQDFKIGRQNFHRISFVALGKLEEFGRGVKPHEQILTGPLADRMNLVRATKARFGLVFMLYEDPQNVADRAIQKLEGQKPLIDFVDDDKVRHRIYSLTDAEDIKAITKMMESKTCVIADGHHRYTTGLLYAKENPAAKYLVLAFCNTCQPGLVVLATHRVVGGLQNFNPKDLITGLSANFKVTEYPFNSDKSREAAKKKMFEQMQAEQNKDNNAFGIYAGAGAFYAAVLMDKAAMDSVAGNMSRPWRSLDVAILHKLIIEKLLGINDELLAKGSQIDYVKDNANAVDDIIAKVDSGSKQAAFFLNPPKIQQVQRVAEQGERMPQKSTYFYPKVFTGLTIQKL
ncbi:MAG: DUF1015 domain-containing protein [Sedimentisphaerales bacterium]